MKARATPSIAARKRPRQARSQLLVEDVLEAALRVLARHGAAGFTTVKVAEEAGVSVGSLYQYFPNKAALLFRLQAEEWKDTGDLLAEILEDASRPPLDRLRHAIRVFFRSERDEAELREALAASGARLRDAPEAVEHLAAMQVRLHAFVEAALPEASPEERASTVDVITTSMSAIGKRITDERRTRAEVDAWSEVVSDMLAGHLTGLGGRRVTPR